MPRPEPVPRSLRVAAFALSFASLATVQLVVRRPAILAERFVTHGGWVELTALAAYAAWLIGKLHPVRATGVWRARLWLLFSVVFFAQLVLGLAGFSRFLMTGVLHLPVPAMIVGGPLYRGAGLFMPILLAVTLVLVGPAWCSYLCYIGAWDLWLARRRKRPVPLPRWRNLARAGTLVMVAGVALGCRALGVSGEAAAAAGGAFGLLGVGVMATLSRRTGAMVHCTAYCPIGLVATVAGKLSPFRLRIASGCDACGACATVCRFDALSPADIAARRPASSCTLCGDCLKTCRGRLLEYRFLRLAPARARALFLVLVVSLHALFLGVARI